MPLVRIEGKYLRFPNRCVNCLGEASEEREIEGKRYWFGGSTTRKIKIPYCKSCFELLKYKTPKEARIQTAGLLITLVGGLIVTFLLFGPPSDLFVLLGYLLFISAIGGLVIYLPFSIWASKYTDPRKTEAEFAIGILKFDEHSTTFSIKNEIWAEQFARLNRTTVQGSERTIWTPNGYITPDEAKALQALSKLLTDSGVASEVRSVPFTEDDATKLQPYVMEISERIRAGEPPRQVAKSVASRAGLTEEQVFEVIRVPGRLTWISRIQK